MQGLGISLHIPTSGLIWDWWHSFGIGLLGPPPPKKKSSECFARHCNPQTPLVLPTWVSVLIIISRVVPAAPRRLPKHPAPLFPMPPALA